MELLNESWSLLVVLLSAFVIGWAAEAAQTFMSRALALSLLAWLQTLPEFAVEANIAWHQQTDLMIANLTGSLRLLVGLGWPMIFFTHFFFQGVRKRKWIKEIVLEDQDFLSVIFLFVSVLYFVWVLYKGSLTCVDSVFLTAIYLIYLVWTTRFEAGESEELEDLPWVARKVVALPGNFKVAGVFGLFLAGGAALYLSVDPFIHTLQKWSVTLGISTFVFIQWVAPFLSEFPEKVSAFNWARQPKKAPMAVMNMVNSNINQWTMLAAMIPLVYTLSAGGWREVHFDQTHSMELALTISQSILGGLLLLDMRFSIWDATAVFVLWIAQFIFSSIRVEVTLIYCAWSAILLSRIAYLGFIRGESPRAFQQLVLHVRGRKK